MAVVEQVAGSEAGRLRAELAATQELVRLIAGGTDLQAILEAVTVLTARLIGTGRATVTLLDGDKLAYRTSIPSIDGRLWLQSAVGGTVRRRPLDAAPDEGWVTVPQAQQSPSFRAALRGGRPDPGSVLARAVLERRTVALADHFGPEEAPSLIMASADEHLPPPTAAGELFGFARLAAAAAHWSTHASTAEAVAAGIWSDLTAWCGEESHHDDVTLLVLRVSQ